MISKINNKNGGFTLIEMLVAVLLLTTAIAGPLTIASKGITASIVAKDQVTAFNLAQDAIEYVRFKRDTNRLSGASWLTGLSGGVCDGVNGCYLDSTENDPTLPTACPSSNCSTRGLRYDLANKRFTYHSSPVVSFPSTIFTRVVTITTPVSGNANEAAVSVRVYWSDQANLTREIVVRENMLNWQ